MVGIKDGIWGESPIMVMNDIVRRFRQPPAIKFRMLVGYPERPLDFREINISMPAPLPDGLGRFILSDAMGSYRPSAQLTEMLNKARKELNDKLIEFHFGPEKD